MSAPLHQLPLLAYLEPCLCDALDYVRHLVALPIDYDFLWLLEFGLFHLRFELGFTNIRIGGRAVILCFYLICFVRVRWIDFFQGDSSLSQLPFGFWVDLDYLGIVHLGNFKGVLTHVFRRIVHFQQFFFVWH